MHRLSKQCLLREHIRYLRLIVNLGRSSQRELLHIKTKESEIQVKVIVFFIYFYSNLMDCL